MKEGNNNNNNYREYGGSSTCYFHPKEVVVGVCHLCLNERLLIIAAKEGVISKSKSSKLRLKHDYYNSDSNNNSFYQHHKPKSYVSLPKLFGIASLFNYSDKFRHHHRRRRETDHDFFDAVDHNDDDETTSTSLEEDESFISIKFGDNGVASWDKTNSNVTKVSLEQCSLSWGGQTSVKDKGSDSNYSHKSVVEHAKPRPPSLRWRKRINQLLQVVRWRKSAKANAGGAAGGGGGGGNNKVVRNNKSWIRTLKNKKTKE